MTEQAHGPWVGQPIPRKEDERFLTGRGNYIADLRLPGSLHIAVLHSSHAHARITSVDTDRQGGRMLAFRVGEVELVVQMGSWNDMEVAAIRFRHGGQEETDFEGYSWTWIGFQVDIETPTVLMPA